MPMVNRADNKPVASKPTAVPAPAPAPVQVPAPEPKPAAPKAVTYTPGDDNDPHAGQGGAYRIDENGVRVPDKK
jgi:hypothetical protein